MNERAVGRPWSPEEDQLLAHAVAIHGEVDSWKAVASAVPGRSNKACRKASRHLLARWLHSLSPDVKKTAWTREEDHLLLELYRIHAAKWALIARNIPGRTDDACSKRYREALDPNLKKDDWTRDEDDRLLAAYDRLGGKWGRVGQELQRSGLGCRNRWRLLQRKRASAPPPPPAPPPVWPTMPYWDPPAQLVPQLVDYPAPFHYASSLSSALSSHPYEKDADPNGRQSLVLPVFAPFDYDDSYAPPNPYSDRPHQFHQLQRSLPHTAMPSAHPVQVDHYPSAAHEERSLSHPALTTQRQPTPQTTSLPAPDSYFPSSRLPEQQATHVPSSMTSVAPDTYYHASPDPQLDVNPLLASSDPLSESRPGYHYAQQRDHSRPRAVDAMEHPEYRHPHVQPERLPTASPDPRYALQPEPGSSRTTPELYHSSQLVRRSTASPRFPTPYPKRPAADAEANSVRPIPRQKIGAGKRSDAQAPLRLSSDLQATPDPSIKPYACGHESCWPCNATSSRASYCTSRGLSDHNKAVHPDDSGGDRPYRCGLEGCGKSWKSINGLQYHLQISKAHFQHAITSSFVSSYIGGLSVPASVEASTSHQGEDKAKKHYQCPHENCPNRYKQLSGLRYHLAHGHPVDLPKQLDLVPPALSRKLAEKMRAQGAAPSSSEHPTRDNSVESSHHSERGSYTS